MDGKRTAASLDSHRIANALIALLTTSAGIITVVSLGRRRPNLNFSEARQIIQQVHATTQRLERSLHDQRRELNDAHRKISAVTKGLEEPVK